MTSKPDYIPLPHLPGWPPVHECVQCGAVVVLASTKAHDEDHAARTVKSGK